jgi:hypothetical protein
MAGCSPFRPFSADVVMAFETPNLREFPRLEGEAQFRSLLIARSSVMK